jgi:hypothetical protein
VNNVPILLSQYRADRRQRNLGWRADGFGREIITQEENIAERIVAVCFRNKGEIT